MRSRILFALGFISVLVGQPSFTAEYTVDGSFNSARSVYATDMDNDGDVDILGAAYLDDDISWWENDGTPNNASWTEYLVDGDFNGANSVYAIDMDGDGDVDILGASYLDDDISWWENDGTPNNADWTEYLVDGDFDGANSIYATDMDGDGDVDIIGSAEHGDDISWWENDGTPNNADWTEYLVDGDFNGAWSVYATDMDNDGDVDIIGSAVYGDDISWWENDGTPNNASWTEYLVDGDFDGAWSVYATDMDNDGDVDIIGAAYAGDDISWWENDGTPNNADWTEYLVDGDFDGAWSVYATDMDNDGDVDIIGAAFDGDDISWWENDGTPNNNTWTENTVDGSFNDAASVYVTDMDNDGDKDILGAAYGADDIAWFENTTSAVYEPGFAANTITSSADGAITVYAVDVDNDGDIDVISGSETDDKVAWYENDGAANPSFTTHSITTSADLVQNVFAADVDSDGDMDILSASYYDDKFAWYENDGATDPSFTTRLITTSANGARDIYAIDIDGDGDMDVVTCSSLGDDVIAWYENNGSQSFTLNSISTSQNDPTSVFAVDLDLDGDIDVLSASALDDKAVWYENDGASDPSFTANTITTSADGAQYILASDLDNDGDLDIILTALYGKKIYWFENNGAADPSFSTNTLASPSGGPLSIHVVDLDNDGDLDVLNASSSDDKIIWYENDGAADPSFTASTVTSSADGVGAVYAEDIDSDGNIDIISASYNDDKIIWYESDGVAPSTPTGLVATPSSGQVILTWTANSESDLASYKVYGGTSSSPTTLVATISSGTETSTVTSLTNGALYYYRISTVDNSGNESSKTSDVSVLPHATDGDYSLSFDGSNDYVSTGSWFTGINNNYTLQVNFRLNQLPDENTEYLLLHRGHFQDKGISVISDGSIVGFDRNGSGNDNTWINVIYNDLVANHWYNVAFTANDDSLKLYVDGVFVDGVIRTFGNTDWSTNYYWSSFGGGAGYGGFSNVKIDEIGIWNEALTSSEITALYNSGLPLAANSNSGNYTSSANIKGYWRFSENSGSTAYDLSGNGNHGTISGASYSSSVPEVTPPSTPSSLAAAAGNTQVVLTWSANSESDLASYKVYGGTSASPTTLLSTISAGTVTYTNTGLTNGTTYYYRISAVDNNGNESSKSSDVSKVPWTAGGNSVSGVISSSQTWTEAGSPFTVTGNVLVSSGVTLTIEAGVTVKFDADKSMQINGELIARGTSSNMITFTSNQTSKAAGDWGNILFGSGSVSATTDNDGNYLSGSILEYCTIEYGGDDDYGVIKITGGSSSVSPMFYYCTIKNNSGSGIYLSYSSSIISNCTINGNGNGISIQRDNSSPNVKENIIKNNTNYGIIIGVVVSSVNVEKNIIYGNQTGILCNVWWGPVSIKSNTIVGNTNNGIYIITQTGSLEILNNIIADNVNRGVTFTPWNAITVTIYDNHLINNGKNETTSFYQAFGGSSGNITNGGSLFKRNTFSSNNSSSEVLLIEDAQSTEIENCNFINNGAPILLRNNNTSGSTLDVENNYWGTATDSEIQTKIYDWNDDSELGVVDYNPYLTTPNTTAPISPPTNVLKVASGSNVVLTWTANSESDVAGYKVHHGSFTGYSYATNVDAGNVTTHTLSGVSVDSSISVTAYDGDADGTDDQVEGYQSWFALADEPPTITSVTSTTANGSYNAGDAINVTVTFSEAVTLAGGNLVITLETGDTDQTVTITSISSSTTASGNYTVQSGDASSDLTVKTIALSAGTLSDVAGNAMSSFSIGTNLAAGSAIVIDNTAPTMTITATDGSSAVSDGATTNDATLSLTFTSSEATTNFAVGDITVSNGTLSSFSATSSTVYTATFTPTASSEATIDVAAGTFTDAAGNNNTAATQFNWTFDGTASTMTIATTMAITPVVTTLAGTGSAGSANGTGTAASFNRPRGVAVDGSGNVYVADELNHLIRKITAAGVVTTLAGTGSAGSANGTGTAASFDHPSGVAVDGSGNVYVADTDNNLIRKITSAGVVTTLAGSGSGGSANGTGTAASFFWPNDVAVDGSGNVYVADYGHLIRKITSAGVVTTLAGTGSAGSANGTGTAASFNRPRGVAVDGSGNVYVADNENQLIRKITAAGVVTTLAGSGSEGSANGTGTAASFNEPFHVAVDGSGNVYVGEYGNHLIRKITSGGVVTTLAASFYYPKGVAVDGSGNVYVADTHNHLIRKIVTTLASGSTTNDATLPLIFTSSEVTTDFAVGDITVSNGSLSSFAATSSTVYTATFTPTADGAATIDVAASTFTDAVGNNNTVATQFNWTYDGTAPTMTIATTLAITPVVTTLAGSGSSGSANGTGTAASFNNPFGVAVDGSGNVYVADYPNHLIRKITPGGVVTTFAGTGSSGSANGTGTAASFNFPFGVAVDGSGNVYVGDGSNQLIRKITSAGVVTTLAGSWPAGSTNGTGTAASFYYPQGVAVDGSGNVYVADSYNHLIRKITSAGVVTTLAGSGSSGSANGTGTAASFKYPHGVAVDGSGNVYVADYHNHLIRKITSAGVVTTFAGTGSSGSANGTGTAASFNFPFGVAVDGSGNVYVGDGSNQLIRKITSAGVVTTLAGSWPAGSTNGTGTAASFYYPQGVAVDGSGNVYVADSYNHLIRKITSAGVVTTLAGSGSSGSANGTGTAASFKYPRAVAVDGSGNVYVADYSNHLIRKITSAGVVTTLAGSGSSGSANGTGTAASFNSPSGVAVDGSGNVYVADGFNHLIRKIATTLASGATTNDATLPLIFTSSEPITGFFVGEITVSGGALSSFSETSSTVYTATFTPTADGAATIDVAAFTDAASNNNTAAATQFNWTYDSTAPTMTITATDGSSAVSDGATTNDATLSLTFTSSEATTNFAAVDIAVTNGALSSFAATSSTVYTATFTPTADGAATIDVAASTFTDAAGNNNTAATQFNWTYDATAPTMTITATDGSSAVSDGATTNDATLSLTFTTSEATTDFAAVDIAVTNGALSSFAATSSTVYTATFTPTADGAATIDVVANKFTDAVGNNNTATTQFNWTYDATAPTMTITATDGSNAVSDGSTTNDGTLTVTFTSSEATSNFVVGDITVSNGALSSFAATSSTVYTATFTPTASSEATIDVAASTFTDAAGNNNTAATQFNWTYDGTVPTMTIATTLAITPVVTTLAGSGSEGSANGTGTAASFNYPYGVAVDGSGNVYVTDASNHLIRKITSAGVVTTLAGSGSEGSANGTGTAASFNYPYGVAVDGSGNVYVADRSNHLIRKITSAGVVTTLAGTGSTGSANGTGTAASFIFPFGVAVDGSGNVYVADRSNHLIRKITSAGVVTTLAGSGSEGSADGTGTAASFNSPTDVAVDGSGNVYVADTYNHLIRKITSAGVVTTLAGSGSQGSADGTGTAASFNIPRGVAVDGSGNVYVADTDTDLIRKITSAGVVTTLAGTGSEGSADGTGTASSFNSPTDVAVDGSGNVYVADYYNHLIRKIATTLANGSTTNDATLPLIFTSSEATTDFAAVDIAVTNGALSSFAATSSTVYTATFTPTADGAATIDVGGTFHDAVGNNNTAATQFNWTYDATAPTMTITATDGSSAVSDGATTNDATLSLTFTTSEATTDFAVGDITVSNGALSSFAATSSTVYTATFTPTADGAATIDVGGTFHDAVGNNNTAATQFNWTYDGTVPTVSSVTSTTDDGTYKLNDEIAITVTFSEAVTVTGTPQLTLETGSSDAVVNYASGSPGTTLTFTYTVAVGNASSDLDYASTSALALNSGTIKDGVGNNATLTLAYPAATNSLGANKALVIDGVVPTVSSVTSTTDDGSYNADDVIAITITFSESVTVTGTPQLTLETGDTDAVVDCASESTGTTLTFNYTVASGHTSGDLNTSALALNNGTIKDAAGNDATLTLPGYANPYSLSFDGTDDYVDCGNDPSLDNENAITIGAWIKTTETNEETGFVTNGTGVEVNGIAFRIRLGIPTFSARKKDNTGYWDLYDGPNVLDGQWHYVVGTFSTTWMKKFVDGELVESESTGQPYRVSSENLKIGTGGHGPVQYFSGSVDNVIIWDDALTAAEITTLYNSGSGLEASSNSGDYTSSSNLQGYWNFNEGSGTTVTDLSGNGNNGTINGATWSTTVPFASTGGGSSLAANKALIIDTTVPTVSNVTSSTDPHPLRNGGYFILGDVIAITITFSEAVTVTGTPQLTLETGDTDAVVNYSSGSGGTTLTFNYTVSSGHTSSDLDYASTSALALNSGTINDAADNAATLTLASPGATNSLGANKTMPIDGVVPATPTGLAATDGNTSITLTWTANTDSDLASYKIYSGTSASPTTMLDSISIAETYTHTGLTNGTTYYYRISAGDDAGNKSAKTSDVSTSPRPQKYTVKTDGTGNYTVIQTAIDATIDGDTVLVYDGTFTENITINNEDVILKTVNGPGSTIINGNSNGACLTISGTSDVTCSGFSITGGLASYGGGIHFNGSGTVLLENLYVYSNTASTNGGGIYVGDNSSASVTINSSKIYQNECVSEGGGINNQGDNTIVKNCLIYSNTTQLDGGGLHTAGKLKLLNSTVVGNATPAGRLGSAMSIGTSLDSILMVNNVFYNNYYGNQSSGSPDGLHLFNGKLVGYNNYFCAEDEDLTIHRGSGNLYSNSDPFVAASSNDYTLVNTSNTIGGGKTSATLYGTTYSAPPTDFNSASRPGSDGGNPDMGAIENSLASAIPTVSSVTSSTTDGTYKLGDVVTITITFTEAVTVTGTPQLTLETGSSDAIANYASGTGSATLTFNYTIAAGDTSSDLDYNSTTALALNSGTIVDADGSSAILTLAVKGAANSLGANKGLVIDGVVPTVSSVTASTSDGTFKIGDEIAITVTFTEVVTVSGTPQLTLETGSSDAVVNYASGSSGTTLTFTYTVTAGDTASDLDYTSTSALALNSGTINDAAGNAATLTLASPAASNSLGANKALVVDGVVPTVSAVTATTADGNYNAGDVIAITVTFSETVTVTGTPQLTLETGSSDAVVDYTSGSGDTTLTFNYTVASGHTNSDLDYASTGALALNSGTINDAAGNNATLTLASPSATNSLGANKALIIDTAVPTVSAVTATTNDGSYKAADVIAITVTFSEAVTVTGTPQLTLETGSTDAVVDYASGSGGTTLTFNYTIANGENNNDLDYVSTSALALNSGTILDAAGNAATLTLAESGAENSISASKSLIIDTTAPEISSVAEGSATSGLANPYSLSFDGSDDYVTVPYSSALNSFTDALTVTAWVKVTSTTLKTLIENGNTQGFALMVNEDNAFYTNVQNQSGWSSVYATAGNALDLNTWYHLSGTYDTQSLKIFINGVLINENTSVSGNIVNNDSEMYIGRYHQYDNYFSGNIDEIAIWNDALTDAELTALYNSGSGLSASSNSGNYTSSGNLQGYWNFNAGTGTTLIDQTSNDNDGIINGATWITDVPTTSITGVDVDYQNVDILIISWSGSDGGSGISAYEYALGTTSGGTEFVSWTSAGTATTATLTGLIEGVTYYLSVRATDVAGNMSSVSSADGITIDLTAPAGTTVSDGTGADINYSGSDTTLSANWAAFTETVSGVQKYEYTIGTASVGLVTWTDNDTTTSVTKSGLSLTSGSTYYISVRATDNAGNVATVVTSNGVTIDTVAPSAGSVTDSTSIDLDWTRSTTTLTAVWTGFSDALSGIQKYEYAIGTTSAGTDVVTWTDNSTTTSITKTGLTLSNGTTYYISVRATDNVGNVSTVATADGITVDTDGPVLETPFEGSLTADIDYQNSGSELIIAWSGSDPAGIAFYEYALGTTSGASDAVDWTSAGTTTADTLYFTVFSLTEGARYYLSVRATDNVGNLSSASTGDGIYIDLTNPVAGSAIDGTSADLSYTGADSTLTVTWSGFSDAHSGITSYKAAIEDAAGNSVVEWTDVGNDSTWTATGLSLSNATTYEGVIRAIDAAGNLSNDVSTNGITVDTDGPIIGYVVDSDTGDIDWTNVTTALSLSWDDFSDTLSGLSYYEYAVGTTTGGTETIGWATASRSDSTAAESSLSLINTTTYYASVRAVDSVANVSTIATSDGFTIDTDLPQIVYVNEGSPALDMDIQNVDSVLSAGWQGTDTSPGSDIDFYEVALGTAAGDSNIIDWYYTTDTLITEDSLALIDNQTYFVSVRVTDISGNRSAVLSGDGILIDVTPPLTGIVNDGAGDDIQFSSSTTTLSANWSGFSDTVSSVVSYEVALGDSSAADNIGAWTSVGAATTNTFQNLSLTNATAYYFNVRATDLAGNVSATATSDGITIDTGPPVTGSVDDGLDGDEVWTNSENNLELSWHDFDDSLSGIEYYEYAFGFSPGVTDVVPWTNADTNTAITATGLTLVHGASYYGAVRATDYMGHVSTTAISNGILVDTFSPTVGLPNDGGAEDLDYQGPSDTLAIYWTGNDTREIAYYQYSVGTTAGDTNVVPWTGNETATSVVITDFVQTHETVYFANVRAFDMAGNMSSVESSDGITADLSAPTVGWVNDGLGDDDTFTASTTTLAANWDSFADTTSGIQHYEYAVGTTAGESDVSNGWVSAGTNTSFSATFTLSEAVVYYVSIRAIDNVNNISELVTSNGITTDFTGPQGTWVIDGDSSDIDWQNYTDSYSGYWLHFIEEGSGFKTHEYALYNNDNSQYITSWTATLDTSSNITGISLAENQTYSLHVRGIDSVDNVGPILMSDGVLVDLSAPAAPMNLVGWFSTERIYLVWDQNEEPDLDHYSIYGGTEMNSSTLLFTTTDSIAEAFMPEFEDSITYYLRITATDIPGNESAFTMDVMGIPQPAAITRINPDPINFLNAEDTQLSIHFSQPLLDIGAASAVTIAYQNMDLTSSYFAVDTAIIIQFNDPYASLDSITLTISYIRDWSDTGTDDKEIQLTTYMLADYDKNFQIDAIDLASNLTGWKNEDYSYELGPVTGTVPHFIPTPNNVYDLDDVMAFVQMWYWYHQTFSFSMGTLADIGGLLQIEQQDRSLIVTLPDGAIAGQVFIQYPPASKNLTTAADATNKNRIYLSRNDDAKGEMLVEWADLSQNGMQTVSFDAQSLDRNDANITIGYTIYGADQEIINRGMQNMRLVAIPEDYALHHNYPNPFNPITTMLYDLPETGHTRLIIYDLLGREVHVLIDKVMNPGYYSTQWNGRNSQGQMVGAGVYLYQIQSNGFIQTRKMLLLK